jgi:hypothetical protein
VLLSLKKDLEFRGGRKSEFIAEAAEIEAEMKRLGISESGDFTARINRLSSYVIGEIRASLERGEKLTPEKLTNIVYRGGIAAACRPVK